mmetsp:Transcript_94241/g.236519  ORF Transcript_94241/g.236519 Transcript_94241/m.236519 type:complete len:226 (-) Transcript_94241:159-836(-)
MPCSRNRSLRSSARSRCRWRRSARRSRPASPSWSSSATTRARTPTAWRRPAPASPASSSRSTSSTRGVRPPLLQEAELQGPELQGAELQVAKVEALQEGIGRRSRQLTTPRPRPANASSSRSTRTARPSSSARARRPTARSSECPWTQGCSRSSTRRTPGRTSSAARAWTPGPLAGSSSARGSARRRCSCSPPGHPCCSPRIATARNAFTLRAWICCRRRCSAWP